MQRSDPDCGLVHQVEEVVAVLGLAEEVVEGLALEELGHDIGPPPNAARGMDPQQVRVIEAGERLALPAEAIELGRAGRALAEELDRDPALDADVLGQEDVREGPRA